MNAFRVEEAMKVAKPNNKVAKMPKPSEVLDHRPKLIEGLKFSSQEFYARVEKALADRQVSPSPFSCIAEEARARSNINGPLELIAPQGMR